MVDFYFGAMSPYSWLSAERLEQLLPRAHWRPLFVGGLFNATGRRSWGLTERREEEIAECERRARAYGLGEISWPEAWPTSDLAVARAMTWAAQRGQVREYALAAMRLCFREGADLSHSQTVLEAATRAGLPAGELQTALADQQLKAALRRETDAAHGRGVFGVPTFAIGEELFWGDDRLPEVVAAASR